MLAPQTRTKPVLKKSSLAKPLMVPIQSRVVSKSGISIIIGDSTYQAPPLQPKAAGGFQVCLVDRESLELIGNKSFSTNHPISSELEQIEMSTFLQNNAANGLAIISSMGEVPMRNLGATTKYLIQVMGMLGANLETISTTYKKEGTYSLIGRPQYTGNGFELSSYDHASNAKFDSNIKGLLRQDIEGFYSFTYQEYISFHIYKGDKKNAPGIEFGGHSYPAAEDAVKYGGFQVCAMDRASGKLCAQASFVTGAGAGEKYENDIKDFLSLLEKYYRNSSVMVMIRSLGQNPLSRKRWDQQSQDAFFLYTFRFGASSNAALNLLVESGKTYSLIGRAGLEVGFASQAGSVIFEDADQTLNGVFHQNRKGWFDIMISSQNEYTSYEFYSIINQKPIAWPFPSTGDGKETKAYQYISQKVTGTDSIRAAYPNLNASISDYHADILALSFSRGHGFSREVFKQVQAQLATETQYVGSVRNLFQNMNDLAQKSRISHQKELKTVLDNLKIPTDSSKHSGNMMWLDLLRTSIMVAAVVDPDPASKMVLGTASAGLYLGMAMSNSAGQATTQNNAYPVNKLSNAIDAAFEAALNTNGVNESIALSDWGKLKTIGEKIEQNAGQWNWDPDKTPDIIENMKPGTRQYYYKMLMPQNWQLVKFNKTRWNDPKKYYFKDWEEGFEHGSWRKVYPYKSAPAYSYWKDPYGVLYLIVLHGDPHYPSMPTLPPEDLVSDLFESCHIIKPNFFFKGGGWNFHYISPMTDS